MSDVQLYHMVTKKEISPYLLFTHSPNNFLNDVIQDKVLQNSESYLVKDY